MYINFKIIDKFLKEFKIEDLFFILAVKQQDQENIEEYCNLSSSQKLLDLKYLKRIKNGNLRIDKKGTEFLRDLEKSDEISESTEVIAEWLIKTYKDKEGGIVKNKTETKRRIQFFSDQTGFTHNKLAILLGIYLANVYDKNSGQSLQEFMAENRMGVISYLADNICWKPKDNFARHYNLNDSPLYQFYLEHQEYVEQAWHEKGIEI